MKAGFMILAAGAFLALAGSSLSAAPVAPAGVGTNSDVVLVAGDCGRGWHRGSYGGCRRNLSPSYPCYYVRGSYGRWRLICR